MDTDIWVKDFLTIRGNMFGFGRLKKSFIQIEVDKIFERKPYIRAALRMISPLAKDLSLTVNNKVAELNGDSSAGLYVLAQAPFLVGYLSSSFEENGEMFRHSDALDSMLVYRSISMQHLDQRQTGMLSAMNEAFLTSGIYQAGKDYYLSEASIEKSAGAYFLDACGYNLVEIRSIIARNS